MLSYSFARPSTDSLFLGAHSQDGLPIVWLLVAVGATVTVALYSRVIAKIELARLLGLTSLGSGGVLIALLVARTSQVPFIHYALYVWKDVYIVLLVEGFYCYANAVFPIKQARWLYGIFGLIATLGSLVGNEAVGWVAPAYGSVVAIWCSLPALLLIWLVCIPFSRFAGKEKPVQEKAAPTFLASLSLIRASSYLLLLVILIAVIQVVITLIDYIFSGIVLQAYPDDDQRTAIMSDVYAYVDYATLVLHSLTGPILRVAGVPLVLLVVPLLLGSGVAALVAAPRFFVAMLVKVASKCMDYTIFRAAKEILYIPLSYAEKTQGKQVIDVLSYRVAKGGASALLLFLQLLVWVFLVEPLILVLIGLWIVLTIIVARRFRSKVSRDQEMGR